MRAGRVLARVELEDRLLDLADVVVQAGDDRLVVVDDAVQHAPQHRHRPVRRAGPGRASRASRTRCSSLAFAVAHRDDVAAAQEHVDLAELDALLVLEVARAAQRDEPVLVVLLDLRPLMRLARVLDGQLVQRELAARRSSSPGVGSVMPTQTKPSPVAQARRRLRQRHLVLVLAHAVDVMAAVDDHGSTQRGPFPLARPSPAPRAGPGERQRAMREEIPHVVAGISLECSRCARAPRSQLSAPPWCCSPRRRPRLPPISAGTRWPRRAAAPGATATNWSGGVAPGAERHGRARQPPRRAAPCRRA